MDSNNKVIKEQNGKYDKIRNLINRFKKKSHKLNTLNGRITNKLTQKDIENFDNEDLIESIRLARMEWLDATRNFDFAQDEEIIDYYTYQIKASETRYQYLLKLARKKGLKTSKKDITHQIFHGKHLTS